jgi:hypothetical protein
MSAGDVRPQPSLLADLVRRLERGGAGRPEEIARRLGPDWTENDVRAALPALFSGGVVGHNREIGFSWVA